MEISKIFTKILAVECLRKRYFKFFTFWVFFYYLLVLVVKINSKYHRKILF